MHATYNDRAVLRKSRISTFGPVDGLLSAVRNIGLSRFIVTRLLFFAGLSLCGWSANAAAQQSYTATWNESPKSVQDTGASGSQSDWKAGADPETEVTGDSLPRTQSAASILRQISPTDDDIPPSPPERTGTSSERTHHERDRPAAWPVRSADSPMVIPATPSEATFTNLAAQIQDERMPTRHLAPEHRPPQHAPPQYAPSQPSGQHPSPQHFNENHTSPRFANSGEWARESHHSGNEIRPASFDQRDTITDSTSRERKLDQAKSLVSKYSLDHFADSLPGRSVSLLEMVQLPLSPHQRAEMVAFYWEAWGRWAELRAVEEYSKWLSSIQSANAPGDRELLDAAKSLAHNQHHTARMELTRYQARLQGFYSTGYQPQPAGVALPLPSDLPLVQNYVTNYQLYRNYRSMPAHFQNIDQVLPETLQLIVNQAETVQLATQAANQQRVSLQNGQSSLGSVLEAGRIWRVAELELVRSVITYNRIIADYALNVTDHSHPPETVVAMLITRPETANPPHVSNQTRTERSVLEAAPAHLADSSPDFRVRPSSLSSQLSQPVTRTGNHLNPEPFRASGGTGNMGMGETGELGKMGALDHSTELPRTHLGSGPPEFAPQGLRASHPAANDDNAGRPLAPVEGGANMPASLPPSTFNPPADPPGNFGGSFPAANPPSSQPTTSSTFGDFNPSSGPVTPPPSFRN